MTNHSLLRPAFFPAFLILCNYAFAQPGWQQSDLATFTDYRNVWSADAGWREVYFATDNGVWRHDRQTGEPLDPWHTGVGFEAAVPLSGARVVLWHGNSGTLWLGGAGLRYWRADRQRWEVMNWFASDRITSLGETSNLVLVDTGGDRFTAVDPFIFTVMGERDTTGLEVRWSGAQGGKPHPYAGYLPVDRTLIYDPDDGSLTDRANRRYKPSDDYYDDFERRHYICYPKLGVAVADARTMQMVLFQTGLAEPDVRAFAIDPEASGRLWVGGDSDRENGGISLFDRVTGRWERFERTTEFGLESVNARAASVWKGAIFFGTDAGVVFRLPGVSDWQTWDRFDGLSGPAVRAMSVADGCLFTGGERGVNIVKLPGGPIWKAGDRRLNELTTADMTAVGDTVWTVGVQGVYKGTVDDWLRVSGDDPFAGDPARCVAIDDSFLWVGVSRGIRQMNRATGEWVDHQGEAFFRGARPQTLAAGDSLLWVGTDKGLFRFNRRRGSWISFGKREGLPDERIRRLALEADTLWVGTPNGLSRLIWNRPERDGW